MADSVGRSAMLCRIITAISRIRTQYVGRSDMDTVYRVFEEAIHSTIESPSIY